MFCSLHNHTMYSNLHLIDSINRIPEMVNKALEYGFNGLAITDHEVLSGHVEALEYGDKIRKDHPDFKIILGNEIYLIKKDDYKQPNARFWHFILLAKDLTGYMQIRELSSRAWDRMYVSKGQKRTPTFYEDFEEVVGNDKGHIVMSTACLGSYLNQCFKEKNKEEVKFYLNFMAKYAGKGNFFLELQDSDTEEQIAYNKFLIGLSHSCGVPTIVTQDAHYLNKEDLEMEKVFLNSKQESDREVESFYKYTYMKPESEIKEILSYLPEDEVQKAIDNTQTIYGMIQPFDLRKDTVIPQRKLPDFQLKHLLKDWYSQEENIKAFAESEWDQDRFLLHLIEQGIEDKHFVVTKVEADRINTELGVLKYITDRVHQPMSAYLNLVQEIVNLMWQVSFVGVSRGCFTEDAKILMGDGTFKNIKDVKAGELVYTHTGQIKPVLEAHQYDVDEVLYKIKVKGRPEFTCTNNHKIYGFKQGECEAPGSKTIYCSGKCKRFETCKYKTGEPAIPHWIEAQELKKGDFVATPKFNYISKEKHVIDLKQFLPEATLSDNDTIYYKKIDDKYNSGIVSKYHIRRYKELTPGLARLIGYFIGNGWTRAAISGGNITEFGVAFNSKDENKIRDCKSLIENELNLNVRIVPSKFRQATQLIVRNKPWANCFAAICGKGSHNKKIPNEIFTNIELMRQCALGLILTDGNVDLKERRFKYSTTSPLLQKQIFYLFNLLGYNGSMFECRKRNEKWETEKGIIISGNQFSRLCQNFKLGQVDTDKLAYTRNDCVEDDNNYYNKIDAITTMPFKGKVYDLSVQDDTSYIVNGCAVHNSAMSFLINYLIGIVQADPLKYDVPYWRFMNTASIPTLTPEEIKAGKKLSMAATLPDVDLDASPTKADEIMELMRQHYGNDNILNTLTYKKESLKSAIITASRGLGILPEDAHYVSGLVPTSRGHVYSLKECEEGDEEKGFDPAPNVINKIKEYPGLYDAVKKLEGLISGSGIHASAVYFFPNGYLNCCSLMRAPNGTRITGFDYRAVDACSGLKMDFLYTDCQTKLMKTVELLLKYGQIEWQGTLRATYNKYLHPDVLNYTDPDMWKKMQEGTISNLFQFDSLQGATCIKRTRPETVKQLGASNAVMRLMSTGDGETPLDRYVRFRNDISQWYKEMDEWGLTKEEQKILEKYIKEKFGNSVEQEDMMQIVQDPEISNFTLGEANKFRKCVSKKKLGEIEKYKKLFFTKNCVSDKIS